MVNDDISCKTNGRVPKAVKKEFAVIGLGRFGGSICRTLAEEGMGVLAIDVDEDRVNEYARNSFACRRWRYD